MIHLTLYGTLGCHLCEQAEAILHEAARASGLTLPFEKVDIADDPELFERYGIRIPVLRESTSETEIGWPFDVARVISLVGRAKPDPQTHGHAAARSCQNGNDTMATAVVSVTTIA
ncbi:glutaredoxin family protein [Methylomagnum sp.]